jgi:hypothetical protein
MACDWEPSAVTASLMGYPPLPTEMRGSISA